MLNRDMRKRIDRLELGLRKRLALADLLRGC